MTWVRGEPTRTRFSPGSGGLRWILGMTVLVVVFGLVGCGGSSPVEPMPDTEQNWVLTFDDPGDRVLMPRMGAGKFTVEMWIYRHGADRPDVFFTMGDFASGQRNWQVGAARGNYPWFSIQDTEGDLHNLTSGFIPTARWAHVAYAFNGNRLAVITEERAPFTRRGSFTAVVAKDTGVLGGAYDGREPWSFRGKIDEIRVWNYARTRVQIRRHRYRRLTGREQGLMAYYPLEAGVGDTIVDVTGRAGAGRIRGASWEAGPSRYDGSPSRGNPDRP